MALCSGAELLPPTYFMTSCAPHATLLLLDNSSSPLSTVWGPPSPTLSAHFIPSLHCHCLSYLVYAAALCSSEYVGQDEMPKTALY